MAKVCQDWFPKGSFKNQQSPGFYMNDNLESPLLKGLTIELSSVFSY